MNHPSMFSLLLLMLVAAIRAQHGTLKGLQFSDSQLFEGDKCEIDHATISGTCLLLSDCPALQSDDLKTQTPTTCGFKDKVPIVCCPKFAEKENKTEWCMLPYQEVGSQCLYIGEGDTTWHKAQEKCQEFNGNLAEITQDQKTVIDFLNMQAGSWALAWIARTSVSNSDEWLRSQTSVQGNWTEVPDDNYEGCLQLGVDQRGYKSYNCNNTSGNYICQRNEDCIDPVNKEMHSPNSTMFYKCDELKCSKESWIPTKQQDPDCDIPFFAAVAKGELSDVKEFLEKGISPNIKNKKGASIAFKSIQNGHLEILKTLLENGTDPQAPTALSNEESTLILYAVAHESVDVIDILLSHGADINKHVYGSTPLRNAIKRKDIKIIKQLIEHNADVNEENIYQDTTVLIDGVRSADKDIVTLLCANGADINAIAINGLTALQTAVTLGNNEIVKVLLDNKADSNTWTHYSHGGTVLVLAIRDDHLDIAQTLLEYGADPNDAPHGGETALVAASKKNNTRNIVDILLEKGADIKSIDADGKDLMLHAIQGENEYLVDKLIQMGIQIDTLHYMGKIPLVEAASTGSNAIVKILLDNNANVDALDEYGTFALLTASSSGHYDVVETLIRHGAAVNMKQPRWPNNTALISAADGNYSNIITTLLENGAKTEITNAQGYTALLKAATYGYLDIVRGLLEKGANTSLTNDYGDSALILAVGGNHEKIVTALLENGANPNIIKHRNGHTALMRAAQYGSLDIVSNLLEIGAKVNIKEEHGDSALTFAAQGNHTKVVTALLENGSNPNIINNNGDSALTLAAQRNYTKVVTALLENGANPNIINNKGYTALMTAAYYGYLDIVRNILEKGANVNIKQDYESCMSPYQEVGSQCLYIGEGDTTWHEAQDRCRVLNGNLAEITQDQNAVIDFLNMQVGSWALAWIARTSVSNSDEWLKSKTSVRGNWTEVPDDSYEGCLQLGVEQRGYKPYNCKNSSRNYICKRNRLTVTGDACIFPFSFQDVVYTDCAPGLNQPARGWWKPINPQPWCATSTKDDLSNTMNDWEVCVESKNALTLAANGNHTKIVTALLENGANPNINDDKGKTPLMFASSAPEGYQEIIDILLQNKANVNDTDNSGKSALMHALKNTPGTYANYEVVKLLLEKGADPNVVSKDSFESSTPLLLAIAVQNLPTIRILLDYRSDVNQNKYGNTPLRKAVSIRNVTIIQDLINRGANVNEENIYRDETILMQAVNIGNIEVIKTLLNNGVDVNQQAVDGNTAIHEAIVINSTEIVRLLLNKNANAKTKTHFKSGSTVLFEAVKIGNNDIVSALLNKGADPNTQTREDDTVLAAAIESGNMEIFSTLFKHGAKINEGSCILNVAVRNGNIPALKKLLADGENVNSTYCRRTALLDAVNTLMSHSNTMEENMETIKLLVQHKADVNAADTDGITPLMTLLKGINTGGPKHYPAIKYLLDNGAKTNITDNSYYEKTVLEYFLENQDGYDEKSLRELMKSILMGGADVNIRTHINGKTMLRLAMDHMPVSGHQNGSPIISLLLEHGANANETIGRHGGGISLIQYAIQRNQPGTVKALLLHGVDPNQKNQKGITLIELANDKNQAGSVKALLLHGVDPNQKTKDGISLIEHAIDTKRAETVEALLLHGVDPNQNTKYGISLIEHAINKKHGRSVEALILHGVDPNQKTKDGISLIENAINQNYAESVVALLSHGVNPIQKTKDGIYLIEHAIDKNQGRSVEALIVNGVDPNQKTKDGISLIERAIDKNHTGSVEALLRHEAALNQKTKDGLLVEAVRNDKTAIVSLLLKNKAQADSTDGRGYTALSWAAQKGNVRIVKLLLAHGAKSSSADASGNTPLIFAAQFGHNEVVHTLLENGANVDLSNNAGATPLLYATLNRRNDVIDTLVSHGADGSLQNKRGVSPLSLATKYNIQHLFNIKDEVVDIEI